MRIIILQLARLGDILQTLPTIQGLKKSNPDSKITLVTRETFSDSTKLSPFIDEVVCFNSKEILGSFVENPTEEGKLKSLESLGNWVAENFYTKDAFDLLINLTFSVPSSFLAELIPANEKLGLRRAPDGAYHIQDAWSQYFYAQVLQKNMNMLHLNDLFTRIAGVQEHTWPVELKSFHLKKKPKLNKKYKNRIGIQITSSDEKKTLNTNAWAKICAQILQENDRTELVFFGAKNDLPVINKVIEKMNSKAFKSTCNVIAGTMPFHENVEWVKTCDWILGPDTAIIHMASLSQVPSICIHMGSVRSEETGPYGDSNWVIYPASASEEQLAKETAKIIAGEKPLNPIAAAKTKLVKCANGQLRSELIPENFDADEIRNFFTKAYYLLAEFRNDGRQEDIDIPNLGSPNQKDSIDKLLVVYDALCYVKRLADFAQNYCVKMLKSSGSKKSLGDLSKKLTETEGLILKLRETIPHVKPLIDSWVVAKENIISDDLGEMISLTEGTFRELSQNVDIVHDLLQTAVKKAQERLQSNKKQGQEKSKAKKNDTEVSQ